jgi:hypothetical protein
MDEIAKNLRQRAEKRHRIDQAHKLGKIPVISSIDELKRVAELEQPELPAYQVSRRISQAQIFAEIFEGRQPNITAKRDTTENVGPHFDHYFEDFEPWLLHVNKAGRGLVRVWSLSDKSFKAYKKIASGLDMTDPRVPDLLVAQRDLITEMELLNREHALEGPLAVGTRTLIWQGHNGNNSQMARILNQTREASPPAIHQFERESGIGSYILYALQISGDYIPEGFVPTE